MQPSADSGAVPHSFTFGGANVKPAAQASSSGNKKMLGTVAALVLFGVAGYFGWPYVQGRLASLTSTPSQPVSGAGSGPAASAPSAVAATPVVAGAPSTGVPGKTAAMQDASPSEGQPAPEPPIASASKFAAAASPAGVRAPAKPVAQPIVMGRGASLKADADVVPPGFVSMSSSGVAALPIASGQPVMPKPVSQTMRVSQGVSQGLVVRRVQPNYPASALQMHVEGEVNLSATVSKNGDIAAVKIISGHPLLATAAADAVRRWKYKPYLLNGEPVEIQTEVTVRFKLPR